LSDLLVLCYHGVSAAWRSPYALTPRSLEAQLQRLLRRGYVPRTLSVALAGQLVQDTLVVTFDDALASVRREALPVLERLGVPATVFACTAWVGRGGPMRIGYDQAPDGELVSLGWDDLAVLQDAGWEIGSHTRTHPRLTDVPAESLADELGSARAELERRLGSCQAIASPPGAVNARVTAAARQAGYRAGCTATAGTGVPDPLLVPRTVVLAEDAGLRFALKTAPLARRLRSSQAGRRLLAPAYRAAGGGRGHRAAA
jgi:peptidoglycan/xylan/chitin deacetylase (PgdA/CDA1 family)